MNATRNTWYNFPGVNQELTQFGSGVSDFLRPGLSAGRNSAGIRCQQLCQPGRSGGMVDAPVSKTGGGNPVSVRIRPSAPLKRFQPSLPHPPKPQSQIQKPNLLSRIVLTPYIDCL